MTLWLLLLLAASCVAKQTPTRQVVYIGEILQVYLSPKTTVTDPTGDGFPDWLIYRNDILQGIPKKADMGVHYVKVNVPGSQSHVIEFIVKEDDRNPCGDQETYWAESIYSGPSKVEKWLDAAIEISEGLKLPLDQFRVYQFKYSRSFRQVEVLTADVTEVEEDGFTVVRNISCGADEAAHFAAVAEFDSLIDLGDSADFSEVIMTRGKVLPRKIREGGEDVIPGLSFTTNEPAAQDQKVYTTTPRVERTTREIHDAPPVRAVSLSTFYCDQGVLCEIIVPETTFLDKEDGDTYNLKLTVVAIDEKPSWLVYKHKKMRGISREAGEFEFRLEARDTAGQMVTAPFKVIVKAAPPTNHLVHSELEDTSTKLLEHEPHLITEYVHSLASAFNLKYTKPNQITIRDMKTEGVNVIITWSNNTLENKECNHEALNAMQDHMLQHKKRIRTTFIKAHGSVFQVKNVKFELKGNCVEATETVTTAPSVQSTQESSIPWVPLMIIMALLLILLALCLITFGLKKKNKKEKPSEFMSKGMPVVFPEEVGEDHEMAHATTPMLTKEERPPLKTFQVSQHENPLYRPPPPLAAASPRVGSSVNTAPNQRMPPPYVPP